MRADQLEQTGIDRRPDAVCRLPRIVIELQLRHVLDRDLDLHLHRLETARVDDGHVARSAAEELGHLLERSLCCGEADSLRLDLGQCRQSLETQREVRAALGGGDGVDLIDDQPADRGQDLARRAGEEQIERLRRRDKDVWRVAFHRAADLRRRIAGADRDCDVRRDAAAGLDLAPEPN
jgi:hypothetical protein